METRASHVLVGLFVVILSLAGAAAAIWFARAQFDRQFDVYEVVFRSSVAGLQNGAQVTYQGIQVGRVTRIRFDPNDVERVLVRVEVEPTTPVTDDTIGRLEPQGITGIFFVQLAGGDNESEPLPSRPGDPALIPGAPSTIERLTTDAPELLNRGVLLLERAAQLLDDANIATITRTLEDIEAVTSAVAERRDNVGGLIDETAALVTDMRDATVQMQATLDRLDRTAGFVERDIEGLLTAGETGLTELGEAAASIDRAATQMNLMLRDIRDPMRDFAQGGLYEFDALIGETRQLVSTASRITREFERDPAGFLLGGSFTGFQAD